MAVEKDYHCKRHKAKKLRIFKRPLKLVFQENTKTIQVPLENVRVMEIRR